MPTIYDEYPLVRYPLAQAHALNHGLQVIESCFTCRALADPDDEEEEDYPDDTR